MILWNREFLLGPAFHFGDIAGFRDEAQIQLILADWRLAGITSAQKLQHDAISKSVRKRKVCLQGNAFLGYARQRIAKPGHRGVASIGSNQNARLKDFAARFDRPDGVTQRNRRNGCSFANFGAELLRSRHEKCVEKIALNRDLRIIAAREGNSQ